MYEMHVCQKPDAPVTTAAHAAAAERVGMSTRPDLARNPVGWKCMATTLVLVAESCTRRWLQGDVRPHFVLGIVLFCLIFSLGLSIFAPFLPLQHPNVEV